KDGVAAKFTGSVRAPTTPGGTDGTFNIPGVTVSASQIILAINTSAVPFSETFPVGAGNVTVDVPCGPCLHTEIDNATLQVGGSNGPSLTGSFVFDQSFIAGFGSGTAEGGGATVTSAAVADVNGDGSLDLVLGVSGGSDQLLLNQ